MSPAAKAPMLQKPLWLLASLAPLAIAAPLHGRAQEQVIWEPVTKQPADQLQILGPSVDAESSRGPSGRSDTPRAWQPILWEVVADTADPSTTNASGTTPVAWEPLPQKPSAAANGSSRPTTSLVWEVLPDTIPALTPEEADPIAQQETTPNRPVAVPPPPPPLQALNRSIAFSDGLVGPDIGWRVPNGLRWSQRWFGDATLQAISRRKEDDKNWFSIGSGDGEIIVHANLLQTKNWSVGINHSFRSVQNNPDIPGGGTGLDDGMSSGLRIARAIGDTGGIAFGAEQLIQWDDQTDTGRNIYLMATKGWWLGNQGRDYPLIIANGGFGTGKFSYDQPLRFACIYNVENRTGDFVRDNDLCWSPIGTLAVVFNEYLGVFTEYNGTATQLAASLNLTRSIPIRLTLGLSFADSRELRDFYKYRWTFGASIGF